MGSLEKLEWIHRRMEMERRMEHGLGRGCGPRLYTACIVVAVILMLCGCRTVKSAESHTEQNTEQRKDSTDVSTVQKDSTAIEHKTSTTEREKTHTETHKEQRDSFVTVVDQNGNVVGTREYHWLRESLREVSEREKRLEDSLAIYRSRYDSVGYYKARLDSLSRIIQDEKFVEVEKDKSIKQRISTFFSDVAIGLTVLIIIYIGISLIMRRLRRQS